MIQMESVVRVMDNTGAKTAKCIKVFKSSRNNCAKIGDIIAVSIQEVKHTKKVKKGQVKYGIIIRTKKSFRRINGFVYTFNNNDIVLIDSKVNLQLLGTRIFGPILLELKENTLYKSLFLGSNVL